MDKALGKLEAQRWTLSRRPELRARKSNRRELSVKGTTAWLPRKDTGIRNPTIKAQERLISGPYTPPPLDESRVRLRASPTFTSRSGDGKRVSPLAQPVGLQQVQEQSELSVRSPSQRPSTGTLCANRVELRAGYGRDKTPEIADTNLGSVSVRSKVKPRLSLTFYITKAM